MNLDNVRRDVEALSEVVEGWQGAPLAPVVVEARQLLGVARARLLQAELAAAVKKTYCARGFKSSVPLHDCTGGPRCPGDCVRKTP